MEDQMLAFLQQLHSRVAANEAVSSEEEEEDNPRHPSSTHHPLRLVERSVTYSNGDTYTVCGKEGSMLGDKRHGQQGTHTTSTGDVYSGSWAYDTRHGQGTFKSSSGVVYAGSWVDDKACGHGRCSYPDGSVYEGEWDRDERCGWGTLATADGQSYEGEWQHNQPHGEGVWAFADKLSYFKGSYNAGQHHQGQLVLFDAATKKPAHTYTGRFKNGVRHDADGVGVEEGQWEYRGGWKEDTRWGQGRCRYADGSVFEGEWEKDMRHGSGRLTARDGTTYQGQWHADKLHGVAKAKYTSGEVYVGQWAKGQRHGQGKWASAPTDAAVAKLPDTQAGTTARHHQSPCSSSSSSQSRKKVVRATYVGGWVAGRREGHGVAEYADGGRYEGGWRADKRHGQGLMLFADGVVFRGTWQDDAWLQSAAEPALCRLRGPGLTRAEAGQVAEFVIEARDELSNPRLSGGDDFQVLLVPTTDVGPKARALLTAPAAPLVAASAHLQTQAVRSDILAAAAAAGSRLKSHPISSSMSSAGTVASSTSSGSSSGASVGEAEYRTPAVLQAVAVGEVQDNGDGTYSCSYRHDVAGSYELHITNGLGEHVASSPCPVQVEAGPPSARHSSVTGLGRKTAVAGGQAEFVLTFRDAYGNPCSTLAPLLPTQPANAGLNGEADHSSSSSGACAQAQPVVEARLVGSNTITAATVDIASQSDGSFSCTYTAPAAAGLYVLEVTAGGKHVGGSPFSVKVCASAYAQPTLSVAACERAQAASAGTSTGKPWAPATSDYAVGAAAAVCLDSSTTNNTTSCPPVSSEASRQHPAGGRLDQLRWWGDVARQAYEAIDGCLQGFDDDDKPSRTPHPSVGNEEKGLLSMSGPEADMVKANPTLPVVERLEDLWLLSRLQQERKAKEQQQLAGAQQQQQEPQKGQGHQQPVASSSRSSNVLLQTSGAAGSDVLHSRGVAGSIAALAAPQESLTEAVDGSPRQAIPASSLHSHHASSQQFSETGLRESGVDGSVACANGSASVAAGCIQPAAGVVKSSLYELD